MAFEHGGSSARLRGERRSFARRRNGDGQRGPRLLTAIIVIERFPQMTITHPCDNAALRHYASRRRRDGSSRND
jgi:hypothetical protein